MNNINFLDVLSEHWSINPEQVSSMRVYESSIYLYINDAEEPSIRIECENEKAAQSFFTLWKMRINDSKKKTKKGTQMTDKEVKWVSLKELLKLLKEMDVWTMDTKYLHLYLDTRFINGDWHCTIRDRENNKYLSIEELKEIRGKFNDR